MNKEKENQDSSETPEFSAAFIERMQGASYSKITREELAERNRLRDAKQNKDSDNNLNTAVEGK